MSEFRKQKRFNQNHTTNLNYLPNLGYELLETYFEIIFKLIN